MASKLLRAVSARTRTVLGSSVRNMSSLTPDQTRFEKFKSSASKAWNNLDQRLQSNIIDGLVKSFFVLTTGGGSYLMLIRTWELKLEKVKADQIQMRQDVEKEFAKIKAEIDSLSKFTKESDLKIDKVHSEVREMNFLREIWMAYAFKRDSQSNIKSQG